MKTFSYTFIQSIVYTLLKILLLFFYLFIFLVYSDARKREKRLHYLAINILYTETGNVNIKRDFFKFQVTIGRNYGDRKETTLLRSAKISSTQKVDQPQKKSTKGLYMIKCCSCLLIDFVSPTQPCNAKRVNS